MANKRNISQTKPEFGQSRSKAFNTSKRQFKPNMQWKRLYVSELGRWVRVQLTAGELRTVSKIGLKAYLSQQGMRLEDVL